MGIVLAIFALGFLIVVHEAGHYVVARWCKMRVERFSVGFGPGILKHKNQHGTVFQLAPLPFGGFVEIRGMNIAEEVDPEDHQAYPNRPAWQRFLTILAGPATNYISAIFLAFGLYTCHGQEGDTYYIDGVNDGYDAKTKLQSGDRVIAVNGEPMFAPAPSRIVAAVQKGGGKPIQLTVLRGDVQQVTVSIQPKLDSDTIEAGKIPEEAKVIELARRSEIYRMATLIAALDRRFDWSEVAVLDRLRSQLALPDAEGARLETALSLARTDDNRPKYRIGILNAPDVVPVGFGEAARDAMVYPIDQTKVILGGLRDIFVGKEELDAGGPVRIVSEFRTAFDRGLPYGIRLLMMLSVYLGLFNLFPLPALDGGRLVFLAYEMITRRRANPKIETMVHMGGIMVLMVVMILVTLGDVGVL